MCFQVQFSQEVIHFVQDTMLLVIEMVQGFLSHCNKEFKRAMLRNGSVLSLGLYMPLLPVNKVKSY